MWKIKPESVAESPVSFPRFGSCRRVSVSHSSSHLNKVAVMVMSMVAMTTLIDDWNDVGRTHSSSDFCSESFELVQRPDMENLDKHWCHNCEDDDGGDTDDGDDVDEGNLLKKLKSVTTDKV